MIIILCLVLTGCGKEAVVEEPEVQKPQYGEILDSIVWDDKEISKITPPTSFEEGDDYLRVYPCSEVNNYVEVKKILISKNKFWKSMKNQFHDSDNLVDKGDYSYVTMSNGTTIGYMKLDKETAYTVTTTLPSYYVEMVLKSLCSTGT